MNIDVQIKSELSFLGNSLLNEIIASSSILQFEKNTELLREGQFVKVIPIVISGLIKVFSRSRRKNYSYII